MTHPELHRTNPDFVIYVPAGEGSGKRDGGNAGLTVLTCASGELLAFWMQDSAEQAVDVRYVLSRSRDHGLTWTAPIPIAGQDFDPQTGLNKICFGTAFRNRHGRIYILLNRFSGFSDPHENGFLHAFYSDDDAHTLSPEVALDFKKFPEFDNDDPRIPPTWIPFQPPVRLSSGLFAGGISRYCTHQKFPRREHWLDEESVCSMYLIENADDNPEPQDLKFTWTAHLTAPARRNADWHVGQEPAIVELPDKRLFCVFRTNYGSPWYAVSNDGGRSWQPPEVLRFGDGLPAVKHPLSPCPLYASPKGQFYLFIHNHDGNFGPFGPDDADDHRRPIYLLRGTFTPNAHQPITFGTPEFFFDDNGIKLGYARKRADLALYGSMTSDGQGRDILWYPDRKYFLCGKYI